MQPDLRVETMPVAALAPYAANARLHPTEQVAQLAASIAEFGFNVPVLVDDAGVLIAGHGRVLAAKALGLQEVPAIRLGHLTEAQARAYRLADNQLALNSTWDEGLLAAELRALRTEEFDLGLIGFDGAMLDRLLADAAPDAPAAAGGDPDAPAPEPPAAPVTRPGDLWLLGPHRLLCGDSTSAADVARLLDGARPHLMVTDPPYGVNYDPEWRNEAGVSATSRSSRWLAWLRMIRWVSESFISGLLVRHPRIRVLRPRAPCGAMRRRSAARDACFALRRGLRAGGMPRDTACPSPWQRSTAATA